MMHSLQTKVKRTLMGLARSVHMGCNLVAGGGFEPQVRTDSTQVIDSALRKIGTIGENGDSFLHFSYTLLFL